MTPKKQSAPESIYQLKVTLRDSKPPIWRRLQVPADIALSDLHWVLQIAMGWTNSHLHQFIIGEEYYTDPRFELEMGEKSTYKARLNQVVPREGDKFAYEYDFGDDWWHDILVEKILPPEPGVHYPICVKGKRACPPEDCGGVWGYDSLLEAIQDAEHPEHDFLLEWVGGAFDPEAFDLDAINHELRRLR
jgi:hypothetical protein